MRFLRAAPPGSTDGLSQGSATHAGGRGSVQFCLVLVKLRRRLSRCSKICSRVSWASLLLELLRLQRSQESESELGVRAPEAWTAPPLGFLLRTEAAPTEKGRAGLGGAGQGNGGVLRTGTKDRAQEKEATVVLHARLLHTTRCRPQARPGPNWTALLPACGRAEGPTSASCAGGCCS